VQRLFYGRVTQGKTLLHEVDAQHRLHGKRRAPLLAFGRRACGNTNSTSAALGTTRSICARNSRLGVRSP
jgi:hypothetical protein